ncbi:MAG: hypothetical protein H6605_09990 [Flavobacteriales bacterium]|nr:hypothetical protein [Flavobacteriales bacterium]
MIQILDLISDSSSLKKADEDELLNFKKQYPYFQTTPILLARFYKDKGSHNYARTLRLAALYSGNRQKLFEFIHSDEISANKETSIDDTVPFPDPNKEDLAIGVLDKPAVQDLSSVQEITTFEINKTQVPEHYSFRSETENSDELKTEIQNPTENAVTDDLKNVEEVPSAQTPHFEEVPEENISANTNSDFFIPDKEPETIRPVENNAWKNTNSYLPENLHIPLPESGEAEHSENSFTEKIPSDEMEEYDFMGWLESFKITKEKDEIRPVQTGIQEELQKSDEVNSGNFEYQNDDEEDAPYDPAAWAEIAYDIQAFVKPEPKAGEHPVSKSRSKEEIDALLEKFIKKNPSISRVKKEIYQPENMALKSETFQTDVVSESLAKLFYNQGHLHKSLEIYEKLLLQNPEKKEIFAARIELIKEELINKL